MKKPLRPEGVRQWQNERSKEWRDRYYSQGYTYKKVDGHWGWIKKGALPRKIRPIRARIHSKDPKEIEKLKKKITELMKK